MPKFGNLKRVVNGRILVENQPVPVDLRARPGPESAKGTVVLEVVVMERRGHGVKFAAWVVPFLHTISRIFCLEGVTT